MTAKHIDSKSNTVQDELTTEFRTRSNKKMILALVLMGTTIIGLIVTLGVSFVLLIDAIETNKEMLTLAQNGEMKPTGEISEIVSQDGSQTDESRIETSSISTNQIASLGPTLPSTTNNTSIKIKAGMEEKTNAKKIVTDFETAMSKDKKETALDHVIKHQNSKYICPMHPQVINTDPNGSCPICGMDLVISKAGPISDIVTISPRMINMLGVRTAKVKRRNLYRRIDTVGYIKFDQDKIRAVSLRTDGWIEKLAVKSIGDKVRKGQVLFEVYSPKLVNAQEEFVHALNIGGGPLLAASRDRLLALGVAQSLISELEKTRKISQLVKIYAPQNGVITELNIREGNYVPPSKPTIIIADMSTVWLVANIFESQAGWIKEGLRAQAKLPFLENKTWKGKVEYVYPSLDLKTRSLEVRLRFKNPGAALKPNMFANVTIFAAPKRKILVIPREALIVTGNSQRVIMALGEGKFKPRNVTTGTESNDNIEITHGLEEGDEVVISSQFLIDSESSIRASFARMQAE